MKSPMPEPLDELNKLAQDVDRKFKVYRSNGEYFVSNVVDHIYAQGSASEMHQYLRGYRDGLKSVPSSTLV